MARPGNGLKYACSNWKNNELNTEKADVKTAWKNVEFEACKVKFMKHADRDTAKEKDLTYCWTSPNTSAQVSPQLQERGDAPTEHHPNIADRSNTQTQRTDTFLETASLHDDPTFSSENRNILRYMTHLKDRNLSSSIKMTIDTTFTTREIYNPANIFRHIFHMKPTMWKCVCVCVSMCF